MENHKNLKIRPISPGNALADALEDTGTSLAEFAALTGFSIDEILEILANKKPIAQDTAEAIGKALGTSSQIWLNLQAKVDDWDVIL